MFQDTRCKLGKHPVNPSKSNQSAVNFATNNEKALLHHFFRSTDSCFFRRAVEHYACLFSSEAKTYQHRPTLFIL